MRNDVDLMKMSYLQLATVVGSVIRQMEIVYNNNKEFKFILCSRMVFTMIQELIGKKVVPAGALPAIEHFKFMLCEGYNGDGFLFTKTHAEIAHAHKAIHYAMENDGVTWKAALMAVADYNLTAAIDKIDEQNTIH